jgi:hypothetical protein
MRMQGAGSGNLLPAAYRQLPIANCLFPMIKCIQAKEIP